MLPPISYKVHPKMAEILEDKRRRREILMQAKDKQDADRDCLREGRKQYFQENRRVINQKLQQIHSRKILKHNNIREEEKDRQIRIAIKRSQRLMKLIPQRRELIDMLRNDYIQALNTNDKIKKQKIQQIIEARIVQPQPEIQISEKIRQYNIIDTNEGICVICLTSQAHLYMVQCRHLISCKDCEFILRMQKKCPLCRKLSNFADLKDVKKKPQSVKK